jgi:hypothetical protein
MSDKANETGVEGEQGQVVLTTNDCAEHKNWTELETAFLREQSNRDFRKWLEHRQRTSKQTSQP